MNVNFHLNDVHTILAILAIFYVAECVFWIPSSAECLRHPSTAGYRYLRSVTVLENSSGRFVLASLLPYRPSFVCQPWPFAISPAGISFRSKVIVASRSRAEDSDDELAIDDIESVEFSHQEIFINANRIVRVASSRIAEQLVGLIRAAKAASPSDRFQIILSAMKSSGDLAITTEQLDRFTAETTQLRIACTLLFASAFLVCPFLSLLPLSPNTLTLVTLASIVAPWLMSVFAFQSAHATLCPNQFMERRRRMTVMFFSPASAMRGVTAISKDFHAIHHPVTVAATLCDDNVFSGFAKPFLLDVRCSKMDGSSDLEADSIGGWFQSQLRQILEEVVRQRGIDPDDLTRPPAADRDAKSYCPRCHGQYTLPFGQCGSCGGISLRPFSHNCEQSLDGTSSENSRQHAQFCENE